MKKDSKITYDSVLAPVRINLGSKTFWWKVGVFLLAPLWATSTSPTRKLWDEFKHGLIKHKCVFDYNNPVKSPPPYEKYEYFKCKHYGCNIVSMTNEDGTYI